MTTDSPLVPAAWVVGDWPQGEILAGAPAVVAKLAAAAVVVERWLLDSRRSRSELAALAGVTDADADALLDGTGVPTLAVFAALETAIGESLW